MTTDTQPLVPTDPELMDLGHECELDAITFGREVLARWGQPAHSGEPVAWLDPWTGTQVTTDYDAYGKLGIPLYTAPQPVVREPLPVIELIRIVMDVEQQHHFLRGTTNWASAVGRAVERANGIKGDQHGTE